MNFDLKNIPERTSKPRDDNEIKNLLQERVLTTASPKASL